MRQPLRTGDAAQVEHPATIAEPTIGHRRRLVAIARRFLWSSPTALIGGVIVLGTLLMAIIGPLVWTTDPATIAGPRLEGPTWAHPMGTDELGRDTLARIIHGARVSVEVGVIAVGMAAVAGLVMGLVAAFYRGWIDSALMRLVDVLFALPSIVLAIVIAGFLGPSRTNAMIAIGVSLSPAFARVIRASAITVMSQPFVEAARGLGTSGIGIMRRHLLPNIIAPVIVLCSVYLATAVLVEAALSFLGLGTQPPEPSWGGMLSSARTYMVVSPWVAVFPGLAIMLVVLGINLVGDTLRDQLDPRTRSR